MKVQVLDSHSDSSQTQSQEVGPEGWKNGREQAEIEANSDPAEVMKRQT